MKKMDGMEKGHSVQKSAKVQSKIDELTNDLQRVQADFVNFRRRAAEEQNQIMQIAKESVLLQILPLLDNIERGFAHTPKELADDNWVKGLSQVAKQVETTLAAMGVEKIAAVGEPFNPEQHEAVSYEDSSTGSSHPAGGEQEVVVEELQSGYKQGDKVIRPSVVKVGRAVKT